MASYWGTAVHPCNIQWVLIFNIMTNTMPGTHTLATIWIPAYQDHLTKFCLLCANEVLPQDDTTHLLQRPRYQRGSLHQDPAGNRTTRRPPGHRRKTQIAVVRSCLPFIRSGQNHLATHSERGKKTWQAEEEVERQNQEMDRPRARQVPEGSGEQGTIEETGCEIICGAPTTLAVKDRWWWWRWFSVNRESQTRGNRKSKNRS